MPSGWYSCNSYAISKDNTPQGFVLFVQFVFSKIKRQILLDTNTFVWTCMSATIYRTKNYLYLSDINNTNYEGMPKNSFRHTLVCVYSRD